MGLLPDGVVTALDAKSVAAALDSLQSRGRMIGAQRAQLQPLCEPGRISPAAAARIGSVLGTVVRVLEESPVPETEWGSMRAVFDEAELSRLLGVSESSLRRYASGERDTPLATADRLHWIAMVVADLSGAYNGLGIRRWFDRPRALLGGKSPRTALGRRWDSESEGARKVRALAAALSGAEPVQVQAVPA